MRLKEAFPKMYNFLYIITFIDIVHGASYSERNNQMHTLPEYSLQNINAFATCNTYLINFPGIDFNGSILKTAIQLLRYYSLENSNLIFPMEAKDKENVSDQFHFDVFGYKFRTTVRKVHCEALFYMFPPSPEIAPEMYTNMYTNDKILKTHLSHFTTQEEINSYFSDMGDFYVILICRLNGRQTNNVQKSLTNDIVFRKWMDTMWWQMYNFGRLATTALIWETSSQLHFAYCEYCNRCDPYQLILKSTKEHKMFPVTIADLSAHSFGDPPIIDSDTKGFKLWAKSKHKNVNRITDWISPTYSLHDASDLSLLIDGFVFFDVIPMNTTIVIQDPENSEDMRWSSDDWINLDLAECMTGAKTKYPALMVPQWKWLIQLDSSVCVRCSVETFRLNYRFVSCHLQRQNWILRAMELISSFDIYVWIMLLYIFFYYPVFTKLLVIIQKESLKDSPLETIRIAKLKIRFDMLAAILEQGSNLFHKNLWQNMSFEWLTIFPPLVFLILSNAYKGDNITRLTIEPPLVAFDTFDKLIEENFEIYTLPYRSMNFSGQNLSEDIQISNHVTTAVKSELLVFGFDEFSNNSNPIYLKYSKLIENWRLAQFTSEDTLINRAELIFPYFQSCDKVAIIFSDIPAYINYNNLSATGFPVFLGKDVIYESTQGYYLQGLVPKRLRVKMTLIGQTGILQWWTKFSLVFIEAKVYSELRKANNGSYVGIGGNNENRSKTVYMLVFLPAISFAFAVVHFLVFEVKVRIVVYKLRNGSLRWSIRTFDQVYLLKYCSITVNSQDECHDIGNVTARPVGSRHINPINKPIELIIV